MCFPCHKIYIYTHWANKCMYLKEKQPQYSKYSLVWTQTQKKEMKHRSFIQFRRPGSSSGAHVQAQSSSFITCCSIHTPINIQFNPHRLLPLTSDDKHIHFPEHGHPSCAFVQRVSSLILWAPCARLISHWRLNNELIIASSNDCT